MAYYCTREHCAAVTRALVLDVSILGRFKVNCKVMPLHSFANFKLAMSRHRNELRGVQKREALDHGLFGLYVNPSLCVIS